MLFNLSLKNIKKSIKDYSIYFFTLVVVVAIFYIFNSLDSQTSMTIVSTTKHRVITNLIELLSYISVFVSIILGFLIIYSNNFLIKRRKKEIGLYLTLGMSKQKVSIILVLETLLIGIVSLVTGLLIGIGLSQLLSIFTAKIFEINMETFKFVFSSTALYKTLIYFGIIFILVMIFNVVTLSRYKLIDLLTASRKNEKIKFRNKWVTLISFIISLGLIGYAYKLLFDGSLLMMGNDTLIMIICGSIATLLFFFSLSGFLLSILEKTKLYYNNLNMFILRQINSKINTSVISTTLICLMLLLTIGILAGSISLSDSFNRSFRKSNITDFSVNEYLNMCIIEQNEKCVNYIGTPTIKTDLLNDKYFNEKVKEYVYYEIYYDESITGTTFLSEDYIKDLKKQYGDAINLDYPMSIIKESEYNKILNIYNMPNIKLKDNEYILTGNIDTIVDYYKGYYKKGLEISVNNNNLVAKDSNIYRIQLSNFSSFNNSGTIVVPDKVINNLSLLNVTVIGNYKINKNIEQFDSEFVDKVNNINYSYNTITKIEMKDNGIGLKVILTFIGLYLGIIFALTSVTILAIGQLSESSDNKERYRIIKQIGADEKMINKALFTQIVIIFLLPLVVALFHAFFGLKEVIRLISILGSIDVTTSIIYTTIFIVIVYGGYFMATYLCSKAIIKD